MPASPVEPAAGVSGWGRPGQQGGEQPPDFGDGQRDHARVGWGWLARVLSWPPFLWFVELGYWIVASNRRFFGKFLFTKE